MKEDEKNLLKAKMWLNGNPFVQYDTKAIAQFVKDLSASFEGDEREDRTILRDYEDKAEAMGVSFNNMTKDQQLAVINATGRDGVHYFAFISDAAYRVFTLAKSGFEDVKYVAEGFAGRDLEEISHFLKVFGDKSTKDFSNKFDDIKDTVIREESKHMG